MIFSKQKKQVLLLYTATFLGLLVGVLSSIINTNFLNPKDYGDVRYVQNIINFIASLLLFGYLHSGCRLLAISKGEDEAKKIRGVMTLIIIIASLILIFIVFFIGLRNLIIGNTKIAQLFFISLPVCISPLLLNYINTTAQGDNHIGRLSITRFVPTSLYVCFAYIIYKYFGATSERMILLQMGIATIVYICIVVSTKPSFKGISNQWKRIKRENKEYGINLYWGSLAMVTTNYLAGVMIGIFNTDNVNVGFYTLSLTIATPLQMLPSIIGTTYFKQFAQQDKIPTNVMRNTAILTIGSCILFILFIRPLVYFLYSEEYAKVGVYASWLAIGFSMHGFGDMLNRYLGSHGIGKPIRNASFMCGAIKILGYVVLVYLWNINGALLTTILSSIVYAVSMMYYYFKFVKLNKRV